MTDITGAPREDRLSWALLAYSVLLALFVLVPPYLKASVGPPEAFTFQEAADLFTPLVAIPLAWLVFERAGGLGRLGVVAFLVVAAVWVEGQGIHLAANAIGDAFPKAEVDAFYATIPGDLDFWLDEVLGHWLWHAAWVALSVLLLLSAIRGTAAPPSRVSATAGVAGLVHGVTFFLVTVEGVTTALGIPAAIGLLAWCALSARRGLGRHPIVVFLLVAATATLIGYLLWGATHDWTLPEFSKVGLFG